MNDSPEIVAQLDPDTGDVLVLIPAQYVRQLGWTTDSSLQWILDQDNQTLSCNLVK